MLRIPLRGGWGNAKGAKIYAKDAKVFFAVLCGSIADFAIQKNPRSGSLKIMLRIRFAGMG